MNRRAAAVLAAVVVLLAAWWLFVRSVELPAESDAEQETASDPHATPEGGLNPASPANDWQAEPMLQKAAAPRRAVAAGIEVQLQQRPRLEAPPPPWAGAYAELRRQAEGGNQEAAYRLGLLLYECRNVPEDEAALGTRIEQIHQTRREGQWDVEDPVMAEAKLRQRAQDCTGIPQAARGEYREWIRRAADAGLIEAQLGLMRYLPPGEYCQYLWQCSPEQVRQLEELHREALHYVGMARDAGAVDALWTFGGWLIGDEVLPVDTVEAYAHFAAYDQVQAAAGLPRRFDRMLAELGAQLRPIDRQQAQQRMEELLSNPNCCVLTP